MLHAVAAPLRLKTLSVQKLMRSFGFVNKEIPIKKYYPLINHREDLRLKAAVIGSTYW